MSDERPRNEAAMADILASIRKIVADEDRRGAETTAPMVMGDVLLLTPAMRLPPDAEEGAAQGPAAGRRSAPASPEPAPLLPLSGPASSHTVPAPEGALTLDEAVVADIARAVLREEFDGSFGRALTTRINEMIKAEVARALAAQVRPPA